MMNRVDEPKDWKETGIHLVNVIKSLFDQGSIGVSDYMQNVWPLWKRYSSGERTEELKQKILSLKEEKQ